MVNMLKLDYIYNLRSGLCENIAKSEKDILESLELLRKAWYHEVAGDLNCRHAFYDWARNMYEAAMLDAIKAVNRLYSCDIGDRYSKVVRNLLRYYVINGLLDRKIIQIMRIVRGKGRECYMNEIWTYKNFFMREIEKFYAKIITGSLRASILFLNMQQRFILEDIASVGREICRATLNRIVSIYSDIMTSEDVMRKVRILKIAKKREGLSVKDVAQCFDMKEEDAEDLLVHLHLEGLLEREGGLFRCKKDLVEKVLADWYKRRKVSEALKKVKVAKDPF